MRVRIALFFLLAAGCAGPRALPLPDAPPAETAGLASLSDQAGVEAARARLTVFSSDEMQGRETGTPGERLAAEFLAGELRQIGVLPAGDASTGGERSYFQTFDLRTRRFEPNGAVLTTHGAALPQPRFGDDWVAFPDYVQDVRLDTLETVFAGYGLSVPGHDDYADLDPAGKLVVVMGGKPAGLDSLETMAGRVDPGDFFIKWVMAVQRDAAAFLVIGHEAFLKDWYHVAMQARGTSMKAAGSEETQLPPVPFLFASEAFGERLLSALGAPPRTAADAAAGRPLPRFAAPLRFGLRMDVTDGETTGRNVVGYLPGEGRPGEFVGFGAHYDHHGVQDGRVFNGADDDGSGTIAVLNVAEAFAADRRAGHPTRRSLLFAFHSGEEKGLLGSEFLAAHPRRSVLSDVKQIVALVNLDMIGREHRDSLYTVGSYRISDDFGRLVDAVNLRLGPDGAPLFAFDRTYDEPDDPERIYERSDHYSYAKRGVPIVFFTDGMGANWRKNTAADDYHRPTDDVEKIDFVKMVRTARLTYAIGRAVADAP